MPPTRHARLTALLRYLRIAFSAVCGTLCVLLVMSWVLSYYAKDSFDFTALNRGVVVRSRNGSLGVKTYVNVMVTPRFHHRYYRGRFDVPYWFPTVLFAIVGLIVAAPWIRQLRWRFSLRTLLIATTLVAVLLGVAVMMLRGS
jgi:hypothetical protein